MARPPAAMRAERMLVAAGGDDHGGAGSGGDLAGLELGLHAAAGVRGGGVAGHRLDRGGDALDRVDEFGVGVGDRRGGVEAVDVGQQDEQVGAHHGGDAGREAVVVAVADLAGGDGVVLVDHRHGAKSEQRGDGRAGIEVAAALLGVAEGEQDLAGGEADAAEGLGPGAGERDLADGGGGLAFLQPQRARRQAEHAAAQRDGARRDHQQRRGRRRQGRRCRRRASPASRACRRPLARSTSRDEPILTTMRR